MRDGAPSACGGRRAGANPGTGRLTRPAALLTLAAAALLVPATLGAHDGPPFPILSDWTSGPYVVSIWTDPDATDDGSAGGQFWIAIGMAGADAHVPPDTRARVAIRPLDRPGRERSSPAEPVSGDVTNQFAALVMDHEGPYAVRVIVDGPLGTATAEASVEATYDLRPPAYMIAWYLAPFVLVGALWARLLLRRRGAGARALDATPAESPRSSRPGSSSPRVS